MHHKVGLSSYLSLTILIVGQTFSFFAASQATVRSYHVSILPAARLASSRAHLASSSACLLF